MLLVLVRGVVVVEIRRSRSRSSRSSSTAAGAALLSRHSRVVIVVPVLRRGARARGLRPGRGWRSRRLPAQERAGHVRRRRIRENHAERRVVLNLVHQRVDHLRRQFGHLLREQRRRRRGLRGLLVRVHRHEIADAEQSACQKDGSPDRNVQASQIRRYRSWAMKIPPTLVLLVYLKHHEKDHDTSVDDTDHVSDTPEQFVLPFRTSHGSSASLRVWRRPGTD
mmetsp:Transcript_12382/g.40764  ORF Transcript_12382/g.40764 Transcript_12382/m.40764 type:complete len:223 (-) Transcript_12382:39-707(-)